MVWMDYVGQRYLLLITLSKNNGKVKSLTFYDLYSLYYKYLVTRKKPVIVVSLMWLLIKFFNSVVLLF